MVHQTMLSHRFELRAGLTPVAVRIDRNAAARGEFAPNLDITRRHQLDQIIHNNIDAVLVEITVIPEAEQVQLKLSLIHI